MKHPTKNDLVPNVNRDKVETGLCTHRQREESFPKAGAWGWGPSLLYIICTLSPKCVDSPHSLLSLSLSSICNHTNKLFLAPSITAMVSHLPILSYHKHNLCHSLGTNKDLGITLILNGHFLGWRCSSVGRVFAQHAQNPTFNPQHCTKLNKVVYIYDPWS